ncbi:hypothetical protein [Nocardia sp. SC052]|uniref:hypothetical protein n=1 Tax=Nocardia sichangensis TaxID=3385975 RepID=UPI00399F5CF9
MFYGRANDSVVHRTPYPPSVGDVLGVVDEDNQFLVVRVIARDWSYPVSGSHDWPTGAPSPRKGPSLTLIVEECSGLFHDEYADPAEDEDTTDDE